MKEGREAFMPRVLLIAVFLVGLIVPAPLAWSDNHWKSLLPEGEDKELTAQLCGTLCHNLQKTVVSRKTPKEWERTVFDMVARGAQIFPDEAEKIVRYLTQSFPPGKSPQ